MSFVQSVFLTAGFSGPIATLVGIALAIACFVLSLRAKNVKFAVLSAIGALTLLALLAAIIIIWFAYGVAHTGKDAITDLVVLASTIAPAYLGAFVAWRFFVHLKKRPDAP